MISDNTLWKYYEEIWFFFLRFFSVINTRHFFRFLSFWPHAAGVGGSVRLLLLRLQMAVVKSVCFYGRACAILCVCRRSNEQCAAAMLMLRARAAGVWAAWVGSCAPLCNKGSNAKNWVINIFCRLDNFGLESGIWKGSAIGCAYHAGRIWFGKQCSGTNHWYLGG